MGPAEVVNQFQHQSITSVFCLLVTVQCKNHHFMHFRQSSCVPTSSETWGMYFVRTVLRLILPFCNSNLFNLGHLGCVPDRIGISKSWFLRREENRSTRRKKPLGARERPKNKINPHMVLTLGFEPRPHWWEAIAFTTVPPLLPQ